MVAVSGNQCHVTLAVSQYVTGCQLGYTGGFAYAGGADQRNNTALIHKIMFSNRYSRSQLFECHLPVPCGLR